MRKGYVLRFAGSTRFFQSLVRGNLVFVGEANYAWFTESLETACQMLINLYDDGYTCTIVEFTHG